MTYPEDLNRWADDFAARWKLNRDAFMFQPGMDREQTEGALAAINRIPARYTHALPQGGEIEAWLNEILRRAATESAGRHAFPSVKSGPSLLFLGATGTGKTHCAFGTVRAIAGFAVRSAFVALTAADLYAKLRPRHGVDAEEEFQAIANAPLLIVDDLGAAKNSEWIEEINYRLVDQRYNANRPTIYASNKPADELAVELGERVASRLREVATQVVFRGGDRRKAA